MANNPYVNKVIYGNQTIMDISDTDATESDVVSGKTFYKGSGARSTGSAEIPDISNCYQTTDTAETDLVDGDYVPFYDSSATAKRKTLWSNIKAKLKSYFDGVYTTSVELTQAQYDALSSAEKHDPTKVYYITDGQSGGGGYVLPIASASELGGIKTDNMVTSTDANGVLGIKPYNISVSAVLSGGPKTISPGLSALYMELNFQNESNLNKAIKLFTNGLKVYIHDGLQSSPTVFCFFIQSFGVYQGTYVATVNTLVFNGDSSSKTYSVGTTLYVNGYCLER